MPTDSTAAPPPAPTLHLPDHDEPAFDSSPERPTTGRRADRPQTQPSSDFAQQQAPTALLLMGVVLFLLGFAGCAAAVIGHTTIAVTFVGLGLLTVIFSGRLKALVLLKLDCKYGALKAKFGAKSTSEAGSDLDDSPGD